MAPEENELVIDKIIKKYPVQIQRIEKDFKSKFDDGWTSYNEMLISDKMGDSLRVWPQIHFSEGFFVAKLKKTGKVYLEKEPESVKSITTETADSPAIKQVLMELSDSWGIDPAIWINYRYLLTKTRLWMMGPDIEKFPMDNFVSGGLLLGEQRLKGWKLVNGSAQYFSDNITERRIALSDQEVKTLFQTGKVTYKNLTEDYYALEYGGRIIGSIYHEKSRLRIRLPHLFTRIVL